jgi:hypothetical protein
MNIYTYIIIYVIQVIKKPIHVLNFQKFITFMIKKLYRFFHNQVVSLKQSFLLGEIAKKRHSFLNIEYFVINSCI